MVAGHRHTGGMPPSRRRAEERCRDPRDDRCRPREQVASQRRGVALSVPQEIIRRKRDGEALSEAELRDFFEGFLRGDVADYQVSAMLMAILMKGMTHRE